MTTKKKAISKKTPWYTKLTSIVGSDKFFIAILVLTSLQALWFAFTFQPGLFDEPKHIGMIQIYTEHPSPFITQQNPAWDEQGEVTRDPNYLFYFLMSIPLRAVSVVTDSFPAQVIFMRLIILACFLAGMVLWRRLFVRAGFSKGVSHVALLFLVLTPSIAPFPGVINYDNVIFAILPLVLLWTLDVIGQSKIDVLKIARIIGVCLIACLIKFAFIAIIAPLFLYGMYALWRKHGKLIFQRVTRSWHTVRFWPKLALVLGLSFSILLFIERPVTNIVKYKRITPACPKFISEARCQKNNVTERNQRLLKNKPANFEPLSPFDYAGALWIPSMITSQTRVLAIEKPTLTMQLLYYTFAIVGVILLIYYFREYWANPAIRLMIIIMIVYAAMLFLDNYEIYNHYAVPLAMNGRYLLPAMPIFFVLTAAGSFKVAVAIHKALPSIGVIITLALFSQGGGCLASLTNIGAAIYWSPRPIFTVNQKARSIVSKFIIYKNPFQRF